MNANLKIHLVAMAGFLMVGAVLFFIFDSTLNPNRAEKLGAAGEVTLRRDPAGHYRAEAFINGVKTNVLVDTGATAVSISRRFAERLGIKSGAAMEMQTANGRTVGYATRLDSVRLGGIEERDVAAFVGEDLGSEALLGMSFLGRMDVRVNQGIMTIRSSRKRVE